MKENQNNNIDDFDGEIDLYELFSILWSKKKVIVSITIFTSTLGLILSLLLPNIYESKALLNPINASNSISRAFQNYSGFAGLAGVNLPAETDNGNSTKAINKLTTLSFFENQILPNIYLPDLMALKSWDSKKNILNYDKSTYDISTNTWVRDYSYPQKQIPSPQESFELFIEDNLNLIEDKDTGFITLSIKHKSPVIAKQWVEIIVNELNAYYRGKDKSESEKAISFLNKQISMTNISEVKEAISQLLQDETKKLTLIEANEFYVFEYIDPPAIMEKKSEPKRALICIFSAFLGGLIGVIYVMLKHYFMRKL
ncbi:Wzz/FepE/Etk N-terminal domain-containing protein [Gammaproteobacteria bacterium]|nr:Wzz/FepE/Etk N-terminal domain-containing protein [Gammaproteobacteria bacterium]